MNRQRDQPTIDKTAKFGLSLVDKLSDISFCDKQCSNVNDNAFKGGLLNFLDKRYGVQTVNRAFTVLRPNWFKNVRFHQHVLSLLTGGNPYLLYLTRIDGVNCCLYIDRKLKDGYDYPKIHCVKYQFADELFDGTVFTGELVKDTQRRWQFILSDIIVYKGELMSNLNIISRYEIINKILLNNYTENREIEVCPLQVKKLFMYADYKYMVDKFMPSLSYYCRGIIFNTLNPAYSNYGFIIPREQQIKIMSNEEIENAVKVEAYDLWDTTQNKNQPIEKYGDNSYDAENYNSDRHSNDNHNRSSNNRQNENNIVNDNQHNNDEKMVESEERSHSIHPDNVVFRVLSTQISDIYNLYVKDRSDDLIKYGIALVPNMKNSHFLSKIFNKSDVDSLNICMECRYSDVFDKWVPLCQVKHKSYSQTDVERIENALKKRKMENL
jgi:hypothetical protein